LSHRRQRQPLRGSAHPSLHYRPTNTATPTKEQYMKSCVDWRRPSLLVQINGREVR
jgi:hypothetical protein